MQMPEFLKAELESKLKELLAKAADLSDPQRDAVRNMAYGEAQHYIDTHKPGPYPAWGEGHAHILAGNCVDRALTQLRRAEGEI
jgi:hypothetical protein